MCVVSMIMDDAVHRLPMWPTHRDPVFWPNDSTRITELERRIKELEELVAKAKAYDVANNEPNCEMEAKVAALKTIADAIGVKLNFLN